MTLIIVKNKETLTMTDLMREVLRFIYEPETMSAGQVRMMQESLVTWKEHFDYRKDVCYDAKSGQVLLSAVDQELLEQLQNTAKLLQINEQGGLDKRKASFKAHGIDYRKFHRLPGASTIADFARAQEALAILKKKEPENYS